MNQLLVVFLSLVLDLLSFTLILPLFPSIIEHYSQNDQSGLFPLFDSFSRMVSRYMGSWTASDNSRGHHVLLAGCLGSWFSLLQFVVSPLLGSLSDIYGRKPSLLLSLCGVSLSYLLWLLSPSSFALFFLSRTLGGLSKGNVSLSTAIVTDLSSLETRSKGMASIGISFSIGFIVGPLIGALFASYSSSSASPSAPSFFFPALFALSLSLLNILFVVICFEESLPSLKRTPREHRQPLLTSSSISTPPPPPPAASLPSTAISYISPISLFSFRPVQAIQQQDLTILRETGWIYFVFLFLYSGLEYTLSFLTHNRFNYTSMQQGKMYLFSGLFMAAIQGGVVRRIKPGKEGSLASCGLLLIIPAFIIIGLSTNLGAFYSGLLLYSFASATIVPCLTTIASSQGPITQKGTILGIFRSIGALARALGPIVASFVFWKFGSTLCYCVGGVLLTIPLISLRKMILKLKVKQHMTNTDQTHVGSVIKQD